MFHISTGEFEKVPSLDCPRVCSTIHQSSETILIGGRSNDDEYLSSCLIFGSKQKMFTFFSHLKTGRHSAGAFMADKFLYVFAGYGQNGRINSIERHNM